MATKSKISGAQIKELQEEIRKIYLNDSRPWVIGYSGGKDSSCVLQLIWYALKELSKDQFKKPVYIISSDTLVETPAVVNQIDSSLKLIGEAAQKQGLPIYVHKVIPEIKDTFWVNMIGRGLPAPYTNFRWCTDRMKIAPTGNFIKRKIAEYGEVMIVLGSRRAESTTRAQVMSDRSSRGHYLSWHKDIQGAIVFTPIEDWETDDVWTYIINVPNPWGGNNRELITMYRNAQAGECPTVIDKSTPSCGGGRFGCWTCTVVTKDRSMEAMIENGEEWLQPMLDMRDWLAETQIPENKPKIRDHRRRNGKVEYFDAAGDQRIVWGPYKLEFRKEILRKLLRTQKMVRKHGPDPKVNLIQPDELHKIRQLWLHEEGDWEDSLPKIYQVETDESLDWMINDQAGVGGLEKRLLDEISSEMDLPEGLMQQLFDVERSHQGMTRRFGIYDKIDQVLSKDWRTLEAALADTKNQPGIK
ncbi:MAG TPA: DNA phosphorothioation system sulfurtransferase DndC [Verrucomicrobiae bacterium]|nr:DNA phosphorothioation system sulfurtransferase DndC [Verrucomicrobiae bacterium]